VSGMSRVGTHKYMSISQTLRYRILTYLDKAQVSSTNALTREMGVARTQILEKIGIMKRHGHVQMEQVPERWPTGNISMTNKIWITNEGRAWLKENAP